VIRERQMLTYFMIRDRFQKAAYIKGQQVAANSDQSM